MDARIPSPELAAALARARYMYVTTYSRAGKPGTVPTWLWPHDGDVYFTTLRDSLKARRIRNDGRVTVHVGTKDGPAFEGRAEWVDGRADLEAALLSDYRRKYWLLVPVFMGRYIRKGLDTQKSVLIRITPDFTPPPAPAPR
ncbi:MAG TPA: pyridoxamine 5'-phosphate oxidase family protein [Methylomirabilota bacterium]|jgi:PPOX class probable F420-dependent enzyme|nr:pyridoxamine 5'-phosphate oxidase family protein [Methylomirabilota bacterium]